MQKILLWIIKLVHLYCIYESQAVMSKFTIPVFQNDMFAHHVAFGFGKFHQITLEAGSHTNPQSGRQMWKYTTANLYVYESRFVETTLHFMSFNSLLYISVLWQLCGANASCMLCAQLLM